MWGFTSSQMSWWWSSNKLLWHFATIDRIFSFIFHLHCSLGIDFYQHNSRKRSELPTVRVSVAAVYCKQTIRSACLFHQPLALIRDSNTIWLNLWRLDCDKAAGKWWQLFITRWLWLQPSDRCFFLLVVSVPLPILFLMFTSDCSAPLPIPTIPALFLPPQGAKGALISLVPAWLCLSALPLLGHLVLLTELHAQAESKQGGNGSSHSYIWRFCILKTGCCCC